MKILNLIAALHNWLSDKDFIWWPFSFLRPPQNEAINFKHTLSMTGCFGGLTFVFFIVFALVNHALTFDYVLISLFVCSLGFLLWFNAITRPLWNLRARQLKK